MNMWYVYLLRCVDGTLYCGVSTDVERRVREHNAGRYGAKYTRPRRPVALVCCAAAGDRASACRLEWAVKQRPRAEKEAFLLAQAVIQALPCRIGEAEGELHESCGIKENAPC